MTNETKPPILRTFDELMAWRLSPEGTQWVAEQVSRNPADSAVLGTALGVPFRRGRRIPWDLAQQGLALLVFVVKKLGPKATGAIKPAGTPRSTTTDRYLTVPTAQGLRRVAVDIIGVHESPAAPPRSRRASTPRAHWRIESSDGTFGTVAAYFRTDENPAQVRVLTAAHVVADDRETLDVGGQLDAGRVLKTVFSIPARQRWPKLAATLQTTGGGEVAWKVDAAWLSLRDYAIPALFPHGTQQLPPLPIGQPLEAHLGCEVEMTGQTTGVQVGRIDGIAVEWTAPGISGSGRLPRMFGDLLIGARGGMADAASEPGDSGKGVIDRKTGETIGVVWDGFYRRLSGFPNSGWAFATAADFAVRALVHPASPPPASPA